MPTAVGTRGPDGRVVPRGGTQCGCARRRGSLGHGRFAAVRRAGSIGHRRWPGSAACSNQEAAGAVPPLRTIQRTAKRFSTTEAVGDLPPLRTTREPKPPRGVAQPGLARLLGVQEVAGSNPAAPILRICAAWRGFAKVGHKFLGRKAQRPFLPNVANGRRRLLHRFLCAKCAASCAALGTWFNGRGQVCLPGLGNRLSRPPATPGVRLGAVRPTTASASAARCGVVQQPTKR